MNEAMRKFMHVGLIHFMAFPETQKGEGPILETLKKIVTDPYFDGVAVSWIKDPVVRRQARAMLDGSQMRVVYGAHPALLSQSLNLNHEDEPERRKAIDEMKRGIDEAHEIGAESFVFLSGKYEQDDLDGALDRLVESTNELCEYSETSGEMNILLEVFDYNVDKAVLLGPADLVRRYAEKVSVNHENFGIVVDLSHIPIIGETHQEAITPVLEWLGAVDIGNCLLSDKGSPRYGDHHPWFGFPGGENDVEELTEFLRVLLDNGFLNTENPPLVSFEVKPMEDDDPDVVIANCKRTLNLAWLNL
jgi:sugar phosphate isomerase/epimerase